MWEGEVKNMYALREKMSIELMCSNAEPFGRVTVEGMRAGLVVIGSNSGGTRDIIQENVTGLLFKPGDEQDLADKIEYYLSHDKEREEIADNGRRKTLENNSYYLAWKKIFSIAGLE